jgi:hypothetical protein
MLTALPYRFHFEASCLADFRVPQESRPVNAPIPISVLMVKLSMELFRFVYAIGEN